ncbi:hypothetical protein ACI6Q2_08885 [Chitinophagaceae bacterium LWZ2-11]
MIKNFFLILLLTLTVSCNEQHTKVGANLNDSIKINNVRDRIKHTTVVANLSNEYVFSGGDTLTVVLRRDATSAKKLLFVVNAKDKKFEGIANLELVEDNGQYYLPESTPRLDEKTNKEYMCDSTFSYQSEKISFIFAMENKTQKRLSFIINNSSTEGVEDSFYTLYLKN